jgi:Ubiquitin family
MFPVVVVKWSGKKFDIDLDTTEPGSTFKLQIFSLTGVPPDRQKVLIKGGQLKDDQDMAKLPLKPGHNFMLLGTAEPGFKAPDKKTLFLEDMSSAEIAKSVCNPLPPKTLPFRRLCRWLCVLLLTGLVDSTAWVAEFRKYLLYERYVADVAQYSRSPG